MTDLQLLQIETLAYESRYETEITWCAIVSASNAMIMPSKWLNWARDKGRQATYNNRCGYGSTEHDDSSGGDFTTPKYVVNGDTVIRK